MGGKYNNIVWNVKYMFIKYVTYEPKIISGRLVAVTLLVVSHISPYMCILVYFPSVCVCGGGGGGGANNRVDYVRHLVSFMTRLSDIFWTSQLTCHRLCDRPDVTCSRHGNNVYWKYKNTRKYHFEWNWHVRSNVAWDGMADAIDSMNYVKQI